MSLWLRILPYIGAAILAAVLTAALCFAWQQRKRHKQFQEMSHLQRRNEALNEALRNPKNKDERAASPEGPIEVSWDDKAVANKKNIQNAPMVELVEMSAYSKRKYIFDFDNPIYIGSGEHCHMAITQEGVAQVHCVIFLSGRRPCVRSEPKARTVLKRGKTLTLVSEGGVYLNSGDLLQLGEANIKVRLFKA